jgi:branched-chain amino acid transport system substrate-binding protein
MSQAKGVVKNSAVYFGCDGFDGIDQQEGFDISAIPQEVSYLSHFNSGATEGVAGEFVVNYTDEYGATTLNQFGASAYDCVYALKDALTQAAANGKTVNGKVSIKQMSSILKEVFQSDTFSFSGVTGSNVTWNANGTVSKTPIKYIVKEANA